MSGLEVAQAILKGTSTAIKILSIIKRHVEEDKRATKLVRRAKRKVTDIIDTISKSTAAIEDHKQLRSIMLKCTKEMNRLNRDLTKLCDNISGKLAPHRVAEAIATAEKLDRIVSQLETLETRIEICCTAAVTMSSQLDESDKIKTLIQTKIMTCVSADDVQVLDAHGAAFYSGSNKTVQVMQSELVFVPTLKLSAKDTRILQKYGDLGSVLVTDSLINAANSNFGFENRDEGMRLLQLASDLGCSHARYSMGIWKYFDNDYRSAVEHYLIAFQMGGHNDAIVQVAMIYLNGFLGSKKLSKRVEYLEKGAQIRDEYCSAFLAMCKFIGLGTEKNGSEAFRMAKAAESNANMQLVLGACHFYGIGTPKSERKARINLSCLTPSSFHYFFGVGLLRNFQLKKSSQMIKFMTHFAELNVMFACEYLSDFFWVAASSAPKYWAKCRKWTRKAADLGSCSLQYQYAIDCENGMFGETSKLDAYWYYRLAARQGCEFSQLEVARLYIDGVGVSRVLNKATHYINLASQSEYDGTVKEAQKLRKLIKS